MEARQARDGGSGADSNVDKRFKKIIIKALWNTPESPSESFSLNFVFSVAMSLIAFVSGLNHMSSHISE